MVQIWIYKDIALPFYDWVLTEWNFFKPAVMKILSGEEYVFVCRHAVTQGGYAPGSSVFTFAKALLEAGKKVTILSLGQVSDSFENFEKKYKNLNLVGFENSSPTGQLLSLIEVLKVLKPKVVLTEIEFGTISVLSILEPKFPVIYLSPGYYNLPWYDKIGLTDSLSVAPVGNRTDDFFEIPTYVAPEVLNPKVDSEAVSAAKISLEIEDNDFVIGAFARMEKFQTPFLEVLNRVLETCPRVKVLLAGPNDRSRVERAFEESIKTKRVKVLPSSDAHILGNCVMLGIDTFPTHSGFSVLELMAKGVPVVAKNDREMDANWRQRLPELMRSNEDDLIDLIVDLVNNRNLYDDFCKKTKAFMASDTNDMKFVRSIDIAVSQSFLPRSGFQRT